MALVAASNDVRAIDKKAQQNVGKTEFGKVPMSPKKRFGKGLHCNNSLPKMYTVLTDPIGLRWCINNNDTLFHDTTIGLVNIGSIGV
ncbi:hypothetical protein P8452_11399 [Trifolium repens]|jgi:hypothetical protein|nr:hypothetical protein QL285_006402 [Trifolium repens]WJX22056.1 hypothetical protein P8452_11399 [Trifolium repens]